MSVWVELLAQIYHSVSYSYLGYYMACVISVEALCHAFHMRTSNLIYEEICRSIALGEDQSYLVYVDCGTGRGAIWQHQQQEQLQKKQK